MSGPGPAAALALASLPHVTPARLMRLLARFGDPTGAVTAITAGRAAPALSGDPARAARLARRWRDAIDVPAARAMCARRGTRAWVVGDHDFPIPEPLPNRPPILLGEGARPDALAHPCVAIVGTRTATPPGLADAYELGQFLARAGITVVSGMALGIDGAAHEGALAAGGLVVGVVATGLDVDYPHRHRALYARVRESGVLVGEHGYGVAPHPQRFPERNRIIAALSRAIVVVEATARGGARITANRGADYGRDVFALPGSRRNPAAAGCNALIADGALALLDPGDILIRLGSGRAGDCWHPPPPPPTNPDEQRVLAAFAGEGASVDQLCARSALGVERVSAALRRLDVSGQIHARRGRWWPR
ncbi:MAG: DNA-processing protein DprA [Actinomycetota bacterium]